MPELPEVETVARDLRPRIVGATIVGARCSWARTLRTHTPEAFADAVAGRRVEGVGRRAKLVVVELSGDAALTIHLKMTGQLFVVPADSPVDPYVRVVLELADGREVRFRDIRKFGRIGLYGRDPADRRADLGGRRDGRVRRVRTRAARPDLHAARVPPPASTPEGPAQAAPARPGVPGRRWQHLRRRGAVDRAPAPAANRGDAPPARRAAALHGDPDDPGGSDRAPRQLHRRLHGARRRRVDAGTAPGLPAHGRGLPAMRPSGEADRDRGAVDPLLLVVPATAGRRSEGGEGDPADDRRWSAAAPVAAGPSWRAKGRSD